MARKQNQPGACKPPTTYKPFYVPPDIRALGDSGNAIVSAMRREYERLKANWRSRHGDR